MLKVLYRDGTATYFPAFSQMLKTCEEAGYRVPRSDMVKAVHDTAAMTSGHLDTDLVVAAERLRAAAQRPPREENGLHVMTVHQSKGKEFDAVIIADATARSYPDDLESRNLFYVALTRGRAMWTIIATDTTTLLSFGTSDALAPYSRPCASSGSKTLRRSNARSGPRDCQASSRRVDPDSAIQARRGSATDNSTSSSCR